MAIGKRPKEREVEKVGWLAPPSYWPMLGLSSSTAATHVDLAKAWAKGRKKDAKRPEDVEKAMAERAAGAKGEKDGPGLQTTIQYVHPTRRKHP